MLFNKKVRFSVAEKQIKEDVYDQNGETVLKINIKYPEIKCPARDPLARHAATFYPRFSNEFIAFAKNDLKNAAIESKQRCTDEFLPFSALMNYEKTFENEEFICFVQDITVFDGKTNTTERKTQVWERAFGTKCRFAYFFKSESKEKIINELIKPENKKSFNRELFSLKNEGFEFYLKCNSGYCGYLLPFSVADEMSLTKAV